MKIATIGMACLALAACSRTALPPSPADAVNEALTMLHYDRSHWIGETVCVGPLPVGMSANAVCRAASAAEPERNGVSRIRAYWTKGTAHGWKLTTIVDQSDRIIYKRTTDDA